MDTWTIVSGVVGFFLGAFAYAINHREELRKIERDVEQLAIDIAALKK